MKPLLSFIAVFVISFLACKKNNDVNISGTWKMVEAYDGNQGQFITPPPDPEDFIEITFTRGKFHGHTVYNAFGDGHYDLDGDEITFGSYIITQVLEDEWGEAFLQMLNSCFGFAPQPCIPSEVSINGDRMKISTPHNLDVTFERQ